MYGAKKLVGFIVPAPAVAVPYEFDRIAPRGVIGIHARLPFYKETRGAEHMVLTEEVMENMNREIEAEAAKLLAANVDLIVQCATPLVYLKGFGFEEVMRSRIEKKTKIPTLPAMTSTLRAFKRLRVNRIVAATYYPEDFRLKLKEYFEGAGLSVLAITGMDRKPLYDISNISPEEVCSMAKRAYNRAPRAEAIYIGGGNIRTLNVIDQLESELGIPIVSANQARFWDVFEVLKVRHVRKGPGKLFRLMSTS